MSILVSSVAQVIQNIERFEAELEKSKELQRRLAFARAWYAHKDKDGSWLFAPSKFCGYNGMTAKEYVNDDPRDGRRTEKQLQLWFTQVPETDELYDELSEGLALFLDGYGKPPSSAFRISVTTDFFEHRGEDSTQADERNLADLLIAVARRLPQPERARLKASL